MFCVKCLMFGIHIYIIHTINNLCIGYTQSYNRESTVKMRGVTPQDQHNLSLKKKIAFVSQDIILTLSCVSRLDGITNHNN